MRAASSDAQRSRTVEAKARKESFRTDKEAHAHMAEETAGEKAE